MPFRARFKKAFGRSSSSSSSGNTTPSGFPIEFYKAHEVPRSKYRGPWNQEHQDKLSSFNFSFGRNTSRPGSEYSPAQTRGPSRRSSWMSSRAGSIRRRPSTRGSVKSFGKSERPPSRIGQVEEIEGDDDVFNVGMSRRPTHDRRGVDFITNTSNSASNSDDVDEITLDDDEEDNSTGATTVVGSELAQAPTVTLPHPNDKPFTEEELTKALTEATLRPSRSAGRI